MASQLLIDSNSYFRLARVIKPLLGVQFGDPAFVIHVIPQLDEEFLKSQRLVNKFTWVGGEEFVANRAESCLGDGIGKFEMTQALSFMKDHKYQRGLGVSKVDITVLAVAYLLEIAIISDDIDVQEMAKDFDMYECMSSLEVLHWLYCEGIITLKTVKATAKLWRQEKDLPMGYKVFVAEYFEYFEELPW